MSCTVYWRVNLIGYAFILSQTMKKTILLLSLGLMPLLGNAQETNPSLGYAPASYTVPFVWRVTFLGLGLHNEIRLSPKLTVASAIKFTFNGSAERPATITAPGSVSSNIVTSIGFAPSLETGIRYFYNFERRLGKQKSIRYNSGNYLSVRARYIMPYLREWEDSRAPLPSIDGVYVDALWGFQRTYRRNFYLNLSLGVGVGRDGGYPAGDFLLGYTFPNRKAAQ